MFAETLRAYLRKDLYRCRVGDGRSHHGRSSPATPPGRDCCGRRYATHEWAGCGTANQSTSSHTKFVFLTMRDDPNLAAAALELGPIGFVLKHSAGEELLKAIDHVLHSESYLTPRLRPEDWVGACQRL